MLRQKSIIILGGIILLTLIVLSLMTQFFVDWLWFDALGYLAVFQKTYLAKIGLFLVATLLSFAFLFLNGFLVHRFTTPRHQIRQVFTDPTELRTIPDLVQYLGSRLPWIWIIAGITFVLGLFIGIGEIRNWEVFLQYLYQVPAGKVDPLFGKDLSFYLFSYPAYLALKNWLFTLLILTILLSGGLYWLKGEITFAERVSLSSNLPLIHLSSLVGGVFLVKAWAYILDRYSLLYSERSVVFGASYTDVTLVLPVLSFLTGLAILTALLLFATAYFRTYKLPLVAIALLLGSVVLLRSLLPTFYQQYWVKPNELTRERPYIQRNIAMTQEGYNLTQITTAPFTAAGDLTADILRQNAPTIDNIRLWDGEPMRDTYRQLQSIRLYYEFKDVDVDRYYIDGKYQQVMLAVRELNQSLLPPDAQTWINQRFKFTHGIGLTMTPVNLKNDEGLPIFYIKDIPPVATYPELEVSEPRIYFGEEDSSYVVVKGAITEFDYPKGKENVYTTYQGTGGVPIGSLFSRLLFAWHLKDINLLITGNIVADSRILLYRNLQERIRRVAPFLLLDRNPYPVLYQGKIFWIQDAYTTSSYLPYSTRLEGRRFNYIRNAVKIVVDAYNGSLHFYIADPTDPIIQTYQAIFPTLFRPLAEMPAELRAHIRYPEDLFQIQAQMYRLFHMTDPEVFYNKEDLWEFPKENFGGELITMRPYYIIMRLPGEEKEEFILLLPMVPRNRDNMIAWLAGRSDAPHYGRLIVYEFPKERLVFGPSQIEARIDQNTEISQQLSLWNQMGSRVIRGNLLVIPIDDAILYVEALYLRAEQGHLPELKRVIVSYGERVVMRDTLQGALDTLFGPAKAPAVATYPGPDREEAPQINRTAQQALEHYNRAMESLKEGDWARFGAELEAMRAILQELAASGLSQP
ncbi:MAG: UPF0182 family protein [Nitrospinota bacterium]|nr:MAG: UPF0182 family protein [Nitrospinota bacterium]